MTTPACPLCGRATRPWLWLPGDFARPAAGEAFSLYWCAVCAYGLLWPRPSPAEAARFYEVDGYYTHSPDGGAPRSAARPRLSDRLRLHLAWRLDRGQPLERCLNGARRSLSVCDIGCGNGALLAALARAGHEVLGVEADPAARRVCAERGLPVLEGTAETLPALAPASFDTVVMSHVLEHTLEPARALANAARLLKPAGRLIVEVPNNGCASLAARGVAWPWLDVPRHLNFYTRRSLEALARSAGLQVLRREWTGYCRMFSEEWIGEEQARWERFAPAAAERMPPRPGKARAWWLLARTGLSLPERKYDSLRIVARRAHVR